MFLEAPLLPSTERNMLKLIWLLSLLIGFVGDRYLGENQSEFITKMWNLNKLIALMFGKTEQHFTWRNFVFESTNIFVDIIDWVRMLNVYLVVYDFILNF